MSTLKESIHETVADYFGVRTDAVKDEFSIFGPELGGDSLDKIELAAEVGDLIDLDFDDADLESVTTVGDFVALAERLSK